MVIEPVRAMQLTVCPVTIPISELAAKIVALPRGDDKFQQIALVVKDAPVALQTPLGALLFLPLEAAEFGARGAAGLVLGRSKPFDKKALAAIATVRDAFAAAHRRIFA